MDDARALRYCCEEAARAAMSSGTLPAAVGKALESALAVAADDAKPKPEPAPEPAPEPEPEPEPEPTPPIVVCRDDGLCGNFLEIVVTATTPLCVATVASLLADTVGSAVDPKTPGWVSAVWHGDSANRVLTVSLTLTGIRKTTMKLRAVDVVSALQAARWCTPVPLLVVVSSQSEQQRSVNVKRATASEKTAEEMSLANVYGWVQRRVGVTRCMLTSPADTEGQCFLVRVTTPPGVSDAAASAALAQAAAEWVQRSLASHLPSAGSWRVKAVESPVPRCVDVLARFVTRCERIPNPSSPLFETKSGLPKTILWTTEMIERLQDAPFHHAPADVLGAGVCVLTRDQFDVMEETSRLIAPLPAASTPALDPGLAVWLAELMADRDIAERVTVASLKSRILHALY